MTIEPSPNFLPPRSKFTTWQRIKIACTTAFAWIVHYRLPILFGVVACVLAYWYRKLIYDVLATAIWWVSGLGSPRRRLRSTIALVKHRANIAVTKPSRLETISQTCNRWRELEGYESIADPFLRFANQALYSSTPFGAEDNKTLMRLCQSVAIHWRASRIKQN